MMTGLQNWWGGLSQRERILVAAGATLALLVLAWLIGRGMIGALDAQAERHREAVARAARVEAKAALIAAPVQSATLPAGPLDQWLAQSAGDAGLTLDRNDARGESLAAIAVSSARAPGLIAWLAGLEEQGLVFDRLSLTPGTDGTVALTAEVRRP